MIFDVSINCFDKLPPYDVPFHCFYIYLYVHLYVILRSFSEHFFIHCTSGLSHDVYSPVSLSVSLLL